MKDRDEFDLKKAFGTTPDQVENIMRCALQKEEKSKKRLSFRMVLVTAVILLLSCAAGFALSRLGVMDFFSDNESTNQEAAQGVQQVNNVYEGKTVRIRMNDALFDRKGGICALSYTMENLYQDDLLYILADRFTFGGETVYPRSYGNFTQFPLPKEGALCGVTADLPCNAEGNCQLVLSVLKSKYPFKESHEEYESQAQLNALIEQYQQSGWTMIDPDGIIPIPQEYIFFDATVKEMLLNSGMMTEEETITLNFSLEGNLLDVFYREYQGPDRFISENCEVRIEKGWVSATSMGLDIAYITDEKPKEYEHIGPEWRVLFENEEGNPSFYMTGGGSWKEPVLMADGRYKSLFCYEINQITQHPQKIKLKLETYDEQLRPKDIISTVCLDMKDFR